MSAVTNFAKLANNIFRTRAAIFQGITEVYTPALRRQKQVLQGIIRERIEQASKSEIAKKMRVAKGYYTLEMSPPGYNDIPKIQQDLLLIKEFMQSGCFKYLTVKQAWLLLLVALEVSMWFYLGETIGKMHIVGYKV